MGKKNSLWSETSLCRDGCFSSQERFDGTRGSAEMKQQHSLGCQSSPGLTGNIKRWYFPKSFRDKPIYQKKKKKKYFLLGKCLQNDSQTANEWFTSRLPVKTGVLCSSLQLWAVQLSGRIRYARHPKGKPSNMTESNLTTIMVMSVFIEGLPKGWGAPPAQDQWRDLTFFLW